MKNQGIKSQPEAAGHFLDKLFFHFSKPAQTPALETSEAVTSKEKSAKKSARKVPVQPLAPDVSKTVTLPQREYDALCKSFAALQDSQRTTDERE